MCPGERCKTQEISYYFEILPDTVFLKHLNRCNDNSDNDIDDFFGPIYGANASLQGQTRTKLMIVVVDIA